MYEFNHAVRIWTVAEDKEAQRLCNRLECNGVAVMSYGYSLFVEEEDERAAMSILNSIYEQGK